MFKWLNLCLLVGVLAIGDAWAQDKAPNGKTAGDKKAGAKKAGKQPGEKKPSSAKPSSAKPGEKAASSKKARSLAAEERVPSVLWPMVEKSSLEYESKLWQTGSVGEKNAEPSILKKSTLVIQRAGDRNVDGVLHKVLEYYLDGELLQKEFFAINKEGLICSKRVFGPEEHARSFAIKAPQVLIPKTVKVGDQWSWKGKIGKAKGQSKFKVLKEEVVKIGKTEYPCLVIENRYQGSDESKGLLLRWYSPKVGIVKEVVTVSTPNKSFKTEILLTRRSGSKK